MSGNANVIYIKIFNVTINVLLIIFQKLILYLFLLSFCSIDSHEYDEDFEFSVDRGYNDVLQWSKCLLCSWIMVTKSFLNNSIRKYNYKFLYNIFVMIIIINKTLTLIFHRGRCTTTRATIPNIIYNNWDYSEHEEI